jgi:hypothetical protein
MNIAYQYDKFGKIMLTDTNVVALARTVSSAISSSTEITLNSLTKIVRVYASSKDVYLKWGIDPCASHTFDEIIPAGEMIDFPVPLQSDGSRFTALNVLEREATATVIIIEK